MGGDGLLSTTREAVREHRNPFTAIRTAVTGLAREGSEGRSYERIVLDRSSTPFGPSQNTGSDVAGHFELDRTTCLQLYDDPTVRISCPATRSRVLILTRSQPRSLLSIAR